MANDHLPPMPTLDALPEKPAHYHYLKEFRVEPCALFKQHQCAQHRPYTCFYWHFANQRRRRPVRRRDGTFNYSADIYCSKYDENTGTCPEGDDCPLLHRVAGDVERKYHIRYYKTALCVHASDARGNCTKNGAHCAFAHSQADLRQPVFDVREVQGDFQITFDSNNRERTSFIVEDPVWQDQTHVLSCYKTEPCRKPPRLCRQGYACPYYHNAKDRRRPPGVFKYRSTPCPQAKNNDEWIDAEACDSRENCTLCHSRTEQQFHPEIYKSTKCNDMLQHGYCPRGPFCAFAHNDEELNAERIPVKPPTPKPPKDFDGCPLSTPSPTRHSLSQMIDIPECPLPPSGSAPGEQRRRPSIDSTNNLSSSSVLKQRSNTISQCHRHAGVGNMPSTGGVSSPTRAWTPIDGFSVERAASRNRTTSLNMNADGIFGSASDYAGSPHSGGRARAGSLGNAFTPLGIDIDHQPSSSDEHLPPICEEQPISFANRLLTAFEGIAPQTIPVSIPMQQQSALPHPDNGPNVFSMSGSYGSDAPTDSSITNITPQQTKRDSIDSNVTVASLQAELHRTREELQTHRTKLSTWEEGLRQARQACEAWKREAEMHKQRAQQLEQFSQRMREERDAAINTLAFFRAQFMSGQSRAPASPMQTIEPYMAVITAQTNEQDILYMQQLRVGDSNSNAMCGRCGHPIMGSICNMCNTIRATQ